MLSYRGFWHKTSVNNKNRHFSKRYVLEVVITCKSVCHTDNTTIYILIGRYELNDALLTCHSCGGTLQDSVYPLDVIDRGFWPGSPQRRSKYLFDLQLFAQYNLLQLHSPGLSETGFLKSLAMYSQKRGRVSCINYDEYWFCSIRFVFY